MICLLLTPVPETVIVAVLAKADEFTAYVTVMGAFPLPVDGFIVNHDASSVIVHEILALIAN